METVSRYRIFLYKILPFFISNIFNRLTVNTVFTVSNSVWHTKTNVLVSVDAFVGVTILRELASSEFAETATRTRVPALCSAVRRRHIGVRG